jgi:hypothetical protein
MIVPRLEWRSRFLTLLSPHLHNSTKLPQNRRTKKLYWKKILEGLDKFFKESMLLYNMLKIENILIINIHFRPRENHPNFKVDKNCT